MPLVEGGYYQIALNVSAAGADAVVTLTPPAGSSVYVWRVYAGYSGTGTGNLTIKEGATTVFQYPIFNSDGVDLRKIFKRDTAVEVRLTGVTGVSGAVNVLYAIF